ncbi:hypothetical protein ACS126_17975 [Sphingobacterium lactis]|uniref:hypothetical protein n=1 Tax=Sphingobacterium lactis TaxID=797291 RepID=UPI003EC83068
MATVKFWQEMAKASTVNGVDKMMLGKNDTGETLYVDFDQAKEYLSISGIELEPLVGGDTSATALTVPAGPSGQQRTAEVASGKWYNFGSGPVQTTADRRWKAFWNGTTWSLKDMGALPDSSATSKPWQAGDYKLGALVYYKGKTFRAKVDTAQEPTVGDDWEIVGDNISNFLSSSAINQYTHIFTDSSNSIVAAITTDGDIVTYLFKEGIKKEVAEIENVKKRSLDFSEEEDLHLFTDVDKNVVARIDKNAELFLPGLDNSVQQEFSLLKGDIENGGRFDKNADVFYNSINELSDRNISTLSKRSSIGLNVFPPPFNILRNENVLANSFVENLKAVHVSERITIKMPNGGSINSDSGVAHPYVVELPVPFLGFRYLMVITGYTNTNEDYELPFLYGCKDEILKSWELVGTAPQPFDVDPVTEGTEYTSGHLSDCFMFYNPKQGELIVAWRKSMRIGSTAYDSLWYRSTKDGANWSEIKELYPEGLRSVNSLLSPAILYDDQSDIYHMYYVHNGQIRHRTNPDYRNPNGWSEEETITKPSYVTPWHLEAKFVGNNIVLLIHQDRVENDNLFLASSTDYINFVFAGTPVFAEGSPIYKSSFIPEYNPSSGNFKMKIMYTTDERTTPQWQLKLTETNTVNI